MKYLVALLLIFSISSCSRISERSALKMTEESNHHALYMPIQIGEYYAIADSTYVNLGFNRVNRVSDDYTYESVHEVCWDGDTPELKLVDSNGAVVFFNASKITLSLLNYPCRCFGCMKCLERYAEKGLLTFKVLSEGTNNLVNVSLTPEGEKYLLNNPEGTPIINNNFADVKFAEKKFCKAEKVFENENKADFFVSYYISYTPWAEALGYTTDKNHLETIRVTFTNNGGEWMIAETASTKRNG